jgi:hypothetical protein
MDDPYMDDPFTVNGEENSIEKKTQELGRRAFAVKFSKKIHSEENRISKPPGLIHFWIARVT